MKTHKHLFERVFALNRHTKTATLLTGFACWELVQGAFRCNGR